MARLKLRQTLAAIAAFMFQLTVAGIVCAQSAENVAVVINENSPASVQVGDYYVRKRGIPAANVIRIKTTTEDNIDRALYSVTIETPIGAAIARQSLQDRILYIVLTKGVPLRILGDVGANGTVSSVDSELVLLYRRMTGRLSLPQGRIDNPYYLSTRPVNEARAFTHRDFDIFLVTRLDGFTVMDAMALVDRGLAPSKTGRIVLDQQDKLLDRTGENWLKEAADRLTEQKQGDRVLLEATVTPVRDVKSVLGYYSWGSNDRNNRVRRFGMQFVPGALAAMYVSTDARTFREPPVDWTPAGDEDKTKYFAGTPQSLTGDLVREGATGVAGHVAEPFLESTIRPQILFPAYLVGRNLAEAFYLAMPHVSWQTVVLGDPLCAPFRPAAAERLVEDALDQETLLPGSFSARRIASMKQSLGTVPDRAVTLAVRAEALANRGDLKAALAALEDASLAAPAAVALHLQLALLYERQQEYDAAIERYRRVVELQPRNVIALNNLAFNLATRRNAPADALPLAQRALAEAPQNPALIDTMAWIEHLQGKSASAVQRIADAVKRAPGNAAIRLHAAIINAAAGAGAVAEAELQEAVKLQPALENSAEVKELRVRLQQLSAPK